MLKKLIAVVLTVCLVLSFAACGGNDDVSDDSGLPSYTVRVACVSGPGGQYDIGSAYFKKLVEEGSDGRITVNCYNGDLTTDEIEGFEMVQAGNLEIMWTGLGSLSGYDPICDLMQLPFLFDDSEHLEKCLSGEFGEKLLGKLSEIDKVEAIAFHEDAWRQVHSKDKAINSLEDMKGLKIRSMMSEMLIKMYECLGANPSSIAYGELYTALQTGLVEAQDTAFMSSESDGLLEVTNCSAITNHFYAGGVVIAGEDWLNSLPSEDKELIVNSAKEAGAYQRAFMLENEASLAEKYADMGYTITYPDDLAKWKEAVQPVYDEYLKQYPDWAEYIELIDNAR